MNLEKHIFCKKQSEPIAGTEHVDDPQKTLIRF